MSTITPDQINAWVTVGQILISAGIETVASIAGFFKQQGLTDDQLNTILATLRDDDLRAAAISSAIANAQ